MKQNSTNILDSDLPMRKLILQYSVPGILSGLVGAMYNIVDQIFIGQSEGMLGNAATNVAFPLVSLCMSISLLFGIGGASNFSLALGRKDMQSAKKYVGSTLCAVTISSILVAVFALVFLEQLLWGCGATEQNYHLAWDYTRITAYAIPFFMFATAMTQMIRADGSPKYAMKFGIIGAVLNCILDPIFIFAFDMGIRGAAWATVISQTLSGLMAMGYFFKFKTFKIEKETLIPDISSISKVAALGLAPATNQFTMMVTQIVMNNTLTFYGAESPYGSDIPLAVVGVITKVNVLYVAVCVGLGLGAQPILGYNYGAKRYDKVMEAYKICAIYVSILSLVVFLTFQIFPRQIISIFGDGSEEYFTFGVRYFRIFMSVAFLNGFNPITANFLTSIGKAKRGMVLPFTKQMVFLLPLLVVLPKMWGIDGILLAGPITDVLTFGLAMFLVTTEFKKIKALS